jgi:hypothetical protein
MFLVLIQVLNGTGYESLVKANAFAFDYIEPLLQSQAFHDQLRLATAVPKQLAQQSV